MWRCEKTRKWERNIKRGVGFFPGAAATTEERGTMPEWQIKDARMVSGKNSHFCSSLWHCQPHDRKWLGNWRSGGDTNNLSAPVGINNAAGEDPSPAAMPELTAHHAKKVA